MDTNQTYSEKDFYVLLHKIGKSVITKYNNIFYNSIQWSDFSLYHSIIESQNQIPVDCRVRIDLSEGSHTWIKNFANVLTNLIQATPNHKKWFEECYSYASLPTQSLYNNYCCDQYGALLTDINNCDKCLNSEFGDVLTVNYSPKCLDKLIDLFWNCSNALVSRALSESRGSRFILSGYAGEGKSAWLNNFFSTKQDEMWAKKLFNVKIAVTDTVLKDKFEEEYRKQTPTLPLFFERVVGTKIVRLFQKHYKKKTSIIVYNDYRGLCNNQELILCETPRYLRNSYEIDYEELYKDNIECDDKYISLMEGSYVLSYNKIGPISLDEKKIILDISPKNIDWVSDVERLYKKSQTSLTYDQIEIIDKKIKDLSEKGIITQDQYENIWNKPLTRLHRDECPCELSSLLTKILIGYGYRFLIVFDGVDAHNNRPSSESINERFLDALLSSIFTPQSNPWMASLLIVVREETINKKIAKLVFQGATWGSIRRLRLAPTDLKDILKRRMRFITKSKNYGNFYDYLYNSIPEIISVLISMYIDCENVCIDEESYGYDKSNLLVLCLLRYNRRKALGFIELFVKSILWKLERIGELKKVKDIESSEGAKLLIDHCIDKLKGKNYLFWDPLIYRTKAYYHESYDYKFDGSLLDKSLKDEPIDSRIVYGTIPNIFNFINPEITAKDFVYKYSNKNKLTIRIRLLLALERAPQRIKTIYKNLKILFDLQSEVEVKWEVHEMISVGLIKTKYGKSSGPNNVVINNLDNNPLLEVTPFWKIIKKYIFNKYVLRGLLPDIYMPQSLEYVNFMTFHAIPSKITFATDKNLRESRLIDSISSEIAVITLTMSYLCSHEKQLYLNYMKRKSMYSDNFFSDKDFKFIRASYNSVIKSLSGSKGFLNNQEHVKKQVFDELERVRTSI